ncbi:MAG: OmpH family outer membrane protein [Bacteroidaceae bacterium]|nr:OmpH family outer membrane protein [Bacteroidaceae bacterium]
MKKIFVLLMFIVPMGMLAQQKFGYVNSAEIIQVMPEFDKAQKELVELQKMYEDEFNAMRGELEKKGAEFEKLQQDSVPENILKRRYEELMQLQERLQQYGQEVSTNLQQAEQEKMITIQKALRDALEAVGADGGFVCIFDLASGVPYISKTLCEDVTMKVRSKLGIPANAVPAAPLQ